MRPRQCAYVGMLFVLGIFVALYFARNSKPLHICTVIHISGFKPECDLIIASDGPPGDPKSLFEHLYLRVYDDNRTISSLNDLSGSCKISSLSDALEYVRLRTRIETIDLWRTNVNGVEIQPITTAAKVSAVPMNLQISIDQLSGFSGILSDMDFANSSLTLPVVRKVKGGYKVRRYIYTTRLQVELWEESITNEGNYELSVITTRAPWNNVLKKLKFPERE